MSHNGWRKPTSGLCNANALAKAGEHLSVPKNRAMLAVKRVAPAIGLRAGDLMLLDILVVFTKPQDWEKGARPVVWPSNEYLMEQTGLSLSAVKRHMRKLCEFGLIAYKDSSNGKRWGHRDAEGRIVEAYGFDLSPLSARASEFEALHAELQDERMLCRGLKRKITIARRSIRSMIENALEGALSGDWRTLYQRFEILLSKLPGRKVASEALIDLFEAFTALKKETESTFSAASNSHAEQSEEFNNYQNMNPSRSKNEPHIRITKYLNSGNSNINDESSERKAANDQQSWVEEKPLEDLGDDSVHSAVSSESSNVDKSTIERATSEIDIATIMSACPSFAEMARGIQSYIRDWRDFVSVADKIRPMIGISPDAWEKAQSGMGPMAAAASMALITDKYSDGEVASPGGYLRGLVDKAQSGELHLARSFYGRLAEKGRA